MSGEVARWLAYPSPQPDVSLQLKAKAMHLMRRLEADGTRAGVRLIKKVKIPGNLWEARIDHPTGAYRLFGMPASGSRLVLVRVVVKKRDSLPSKEDKQLEAEVRAFVESLGGDGC
ncbi:MAG: type II toxin-antitoxin system RelE/ParE family toxin [Chloroflexota bacterium]|nr:type II toxin-antitoxin system RelE/ParE family toxin [Chloroflexota bacterium]